MKARPKFSLRNVRRTWLANSLLQSDDLANNWMDRIRVRGHGPALLAAYSPLCGGCISVALERRKGPGERL
ncbi:MAG TPA: hypothetical protein VGI13_01135 [Candidatus Acidoferrum sp.]|jgi:hypothetical protein